MQIISFWRQYQYDGKRGGFYRLRDFIRQNPDWPELHIIRQQLELTLNKDIPAKDIIDWFNENAPRSVKGLDAYGRALKSTGQHDTLKTVMQDWWANTLMPRQDQKYIYSRYKSYIPLSAHVRRLDKLLFNKQYTNARAVARVLGKGYPALTEARIALAAQKGGVDQYIARVPTSLKNDPGLAYERLRWRRKKERNDSAMEILLNPPAADSIINPKDWWRERHIIIRRLLKERRFIDAYRLAAAHQQPGGASLAQAEWLAGWLALRFADKPAEAYERFQSLHSWVKTPISKARAAYWAGRAADALKTGALAKQWYAEAAQYQTVFYGQKAGEKIGKHEALKNVKMPTLTAQGEADFKADTLIQVARLYHQAGLADQTSLFLNAFARSYGSAIAYRFAAEEAARMKRYHDLVRIAKEATRKGLFLTLQSYPVRSALMKVADPRAERALLHALIRQESQFNPQAKSRVGALGLMQIMPATARTLARRAGQGYRKVWLTQKPGYNVRLGSRYIADLLKRYDGSYIMAIAAYNAGPSRVRQWIKDYGDPRTDEIDAMDWGELIPIYETRNYIQRVMEGVFVYRLILKDKP